MARQNFERVMEVIFRHEGGLSTLRSDPGNWTGGKVGKGKLLGTKYGIAAHANPGVDIPNLTKEQAREIYRKSYWNVIKGDDLPAGLDLVAMDGAVNSGPSRGAKWLQRALGVNPDGVIGPKTLAAAHRADKAAIDKAIDARHAFLRGLPTWGTFGKGWSRRLKETREEALRMFAASQQRDKDGGNVTNRGAQGTDFVDVNPSKRDKGGFFAALAALFKAIFGGRK